jgi:hypothetical protein
MGVRRIMAEIKRGGSRVGAGRKAKYEGGRKQLTISCNESQKNELMRLASEQNMTVSEFILSRCLG